MKLSVVIPVYGCRAALPELHRRLVESLSTITSEYEIILVNDNCPQNSWEVIEELCSVDSNVKGIELSRNFGQMKAILAGLDNTTGDWIVVMDCDLQDRPEEIPHLYKKAMEGFDVVVARRKVRQDNPIKVFLANCFYKFYRATVNDKYDGALCNFSCVKKDVIDNYCKMREYHRGYIMYLQWLGYRHAVVDVEHNERYEGKSAYSLKRRIDLAVELLTSQSDVVLKWFAKLGLIMSGLSLVALICLIVYHYVANVAIGWTSIIATIVLMGGLIILVLGVLGIYIGNVFMQTKDRPLYVIRSIIN